MADRELPQEVKGGLDEAMKTMEQLQGRLEAGQEIDEKELTDLSRSIAIQIEKVRSALEDVVSTLDPDLLREEMRKQLSPEDFEDWLANEQARKLKRAQETETTTGQVA